MSTKAEEELKKYLGTRNEESAQPSDTAPVAETKAENELKKWLGDDFTENASAANEKTDISIYEPAKTPPAVAEPEPVKLPEIEPVKAAETPEAKEPLKEKPLDSKIREALIGYGDDFYGAKPDEKSNRTAEVLGGTAKQALGSFDTSLTGFAKMFTGSDSLQGGLIHELQVLLGVAAQDFGEATNSEKITEAGKKLASQDKNAIDRIDEHYREMHKANQEHYASVAEGSKGLEILNTYGTMVLSTLPNMALALASAGTSAEAQAANAIAGAGETGAQWLSTVLKNGISRMSQDPQTLLSFIQISGGSYNEALEDGASPETALVYSCLNGILGSIVEVGGTSSELGGMESLPKELRQLVDKGGDVSKILLEYAKSIVEEGNEEVIQGIIERGLKSMYGKETTLLPTEGVDNAVFDPASAKEEFVGGAVGAAFLGLPSTVYGLEQSRSTPKNQNITNADPQINAEVQQEAQTEQEIKPQNAAKQLLKSPKDIEAQENVNAAPETKTVQQPLEPATSDITSETPNESEAPKKLENTIPLGVEEALEGDLSKYGAERERGLSRNIRTDDFSDPVLKDTYANNPLMYQQLKRKGTLKTAVDLINDVGMEEAYNVARSRLTEAKINNKKLSPDTVPLTQIVANELVRAGRKTEAVALETDLASELTYAGQFTQAAAILRNVTPAGRLAAIQKTIDKINKEITAKAKKKGKEPDLIELPQNLIDEYKAQTDAKGRDEVIKKMQAKISEQMPVTAIEKINAWRYTNMLGNFKTQERNLIGNTMNLTRRKLNGVTQELIEKLTKKYGVEQTKSIYAGKKRLSEAWKDFDTVKDQMEGGKFDDFLKGVNDGKAIFKLKGLEAYRKATQWAMDKGDVIFMKVAYADALGGWLKAQGYNSIEDVKPEKLAEGRALAIDEALKATFHEDSVLSDFMTGLKYHGNNPIGKAVSTFGEAVLPFRKTPANVLSQGLEASPLGVAKAAVDFWLKTKGSGTKTNTQIISELSSGLTGSALMYLGYVLAKAGLIRGAGDDDEELNEYNKEMGAGEYSLDLNDNGEWSSIDWLAPTSLPLFMGVALENATAKEGLNFSTALKTLSSVTSTMIETSMLKGVADVLEDVGRATKDGEIDIDVFTKAAISASTSYLTQLLNNSILRGIELASDETRQTTYTDPDSVLGSVLQYPISKIMRGGIPGDYHQQEYLDAWGRPQKNGEAVERYTNYLFNPSIHTKNRSTPFDDELKRIHTELADVAGAPEVLPKRPTRSTKVDGERLSPDEYYDYAKLKGNKSYELVENFINSTRYKDMSDAERAAVISEIYTFAGDQASDAIRDQRGTEYTNKLGKEEDLAESGHLTEYMAFNRAFKVRTDAKDFDALDALMKGYGSLPADVKEALGTEAEKMNEARQAGVDSEAYYKIKGKIKTQEERNDIYRAKGQDVGRFSTASGILASGGLSSKEQDYVIDILLGDNQKVLYDNVSKALGTSPKSTLDFIIGADGGMEKKDGSLTGADGKLSQAEAKKALENFFSSLEGSEKSRKIAEVMGILFPDSSKWGKK